MKTNAPGCARLVSAARPLRCMLVSALRGGAPRVIADAAKLRTMRPRVKERCLYGAQSGPRSIEIGLGLIALLLRRHLRFLGDGYRPGDLRLGGRRLPARPRVAASRAVGLVEALRHDALQAECAGCRNMKAPFGLGRPGGQAPQSGSTRPAHSRATTRRR
jgi:hypothetical protein